MSRVICVVALLLLTAPLYAQGLSLEEAIAIAASDNYGLQARDELVNLRREAVGEARAEFLPGLNLVGTYSQFDGEVFFARFVNPVTPGQPRPTGGATNAGPFDSTESVWLRMDQTLYAGGGNKARVRARKVETRIAEEELREAELDTTREVTEAYYTLLLARESVTVAEESIHRSEETLQAVRTRRAEEEALEVELLGARAQLASDRLSHLEARNAVALASMVLNRLLGRAVTDDLSLSDSLERPPLELDASTLVETALSQSPELAQSELQLELADALAKGARAHFKPKLQLQAFFTYVDNQTLLEGDTVGANMTLSIPFARDAKAGGGQLGQARARRAMEELTKQELEGGLHLQVRQAVQSAGEAYSLIEVARTNLEYRREQHRVTRIAYSEQLATFDDLLDEHALLNAATFDYLGAHHRARIAEANLARLTGGW